MMNSFYLPNFLFFIIILLASCNNQNNQVNDKPDDRVIQTEQSPQHDDTTTSTILFFGNSLTAGYGLESKQEAFPALIQHRIDSLSLPYRCINAGLSGETSAGGNDRIDWLLKDSVDIFILELGANDGLRGIDPATTYKNLSQIITKVKQAYPKCKLVLAGMKVPPSMGLRYADEFEAIFPKLAESHQMTLIPFLLDRVAGISNLNQSDGIHPTREGQLLLADNIWKSLKPML